MVKPFTTSLLKKKLLSVITPPSNKATPPVSAVTPHTSQNCPQHKESSITKAQVPLNDVLESFSRRSPKTRPGVPQPHGYKSTKATGHRMSVPRCKAHECLDHACHRRNFPSTTQRRRGYCNHNTRPALLHPMNTNRAETPIKM